MSMYIPQLIILYELNLNQYKNICFNMQFVQLNIDFMISDNFNTNDVNY